MSEFRATLTLSAPIEDVFAFFSRPENLLRITPHAWHLELLAAPEELHEGCFVKISMHRWGIRQRMVTQVVEYAPPHRIVDEQVRGPFGAWRHTHICEAVGRRRTRLDERIEFSPPRGLLGWVMTRRRIHEELAALFGYRHAQLRRLLEVPRAKSIEPAGPR